MKHELPTLRTKFNPRRKLLAPLIRERSPGWPTSGHACMMPTKPFGECCELSGCATRNRRWVPVNAGISEHYLGVMFRFSGITQPKCTNLIWRRSKACDVQIDSEVNGAGEELVFSCALICMELCDGPDATAGKCGSSARAPIWRIGPRPETSAGRPCADRAWENDIRNQLHQLSRRGSADR